MLKKVPFSVLFVLGVFILLLVQAGCSKNNAPVSGSFTFLYQNVLNTQACNQCHVPGQTSATQAGVNLDFSSQANAFTTLVSNAATDKVVGGAEPSACQGLPLVTASNLNNSYLVADTIASYNDTTNWAGKGCTPDKSHLSNFSLSSEEQGAITDWVNAGAPNN